MQKMSKEGTLFPDGRSAEDRPFLSTFLQAHVIVRRICPVISDTAGIQITTDDHFGEANQKEKTIEVKR